MDRRRPDEALWIMDYASSCIKYLGHGTATPAYRGGVVKDMKTLDRHLVSFRG